MPPIPESQQSPGSRRHRFDVDGAADYIGVSVSFLNKARLTGKGPTYLKIGARVMYEPADLDAWINSRRRQSTSQTVAA
jgi:hypothetical protein